MPFETVADLRGWIETEPTYEEAQEALEDELEGPERQTAISLLETYLAEEAPEEEPEEPEEEPEDESEEAEPDEPESEEPEGKRYRVVRPHLDRQVGDIVYLDPADYDTQALLNGGQLEHKPE